MKRLIRYTAAVLLALLVFTLAGTALMRAGVDLGQVDARLQPVLDAMRLLHVMAWAWMWLRFGALIDWGIRKGWLQSKDRPVWMALKARIMAVLAAYIILVVIGPGRLWSLMASTITTA